MIASTSGSTLWTELSAFWLRYPPGADGSLRA